MMNPTLEENPSTLLRVVVVVVAVIVLASAVVCGFRKKPLQGCRGSNSDNRAREDRSGCGVYVSRMRQPAGYRHDQGKPSAERTLDKEGRRD